METVLPILDELAVPFGALFESLPRVEWERRELANGQARAEYLAEVTPIIAKLGLTVPDPSTGRKFK